MSLIEEIVYKVEFRDIEGQEKAVRSNWEKLVALLELVDQKAQDFGYASEQARVEKVNVPLKQLVAQIPPENMYGETSTGQPIGDEVW